MDDKYYDNWDIRKIRKIHDIDPIQGAKLYKEYIDIYPYDYPSYVEYIGALIDVGCFEEAVKVFSKINYLSNNSSQFQKCSNDNKLNKAHENLIISEIRLYTYLKKYKRAYKIFINNPHLISKTIKSYKSFKQYCEKKLGIENNDYNKDSYMFQQINDYSYERFLEHIEKHLADYTEEDCMDTSIFKPDFPLDRVLEEVDSMIPSKNCLHHGFIFDKYTFKFDGCGKYKYKDVDYFQIVAFHDTKDLITMYPCDDVEYYPSFDMNYLKEKEVVKVRQISQIDKFNKKYGNWS